MAIGLPPELERYEAYLQARRGEPGTWKEVVVTLDERLDYQNILLIDIRELLKSIGVPRPLTYPETQSELGVPLYTVRTYPLDTAKDDEEIPISGDLLAAWTNGTLIGCSINIDIATGDDIPLDKFNPVTYPRGWERFYLTTTAQTGKTLYLFIGRAAGAAAVPEVTTSAGREVFYTIRSDKDTHFTSALGQYAKENENLTGMITNKARVTGLTLTSDQQLKFKILIWSKDTFDDATNLDLDTLIGEIDVDLTVYGWQIDGSGPWRMDIRNLALDIFDDDSTNELHISLMNMSGTGKVAGASGEVVIQVTYSPRT